MAGKEYRIQGTVVETIRRQGIDGLRVELWGRSRKAQKPSAIAHTNAEGNFEIVVDRAALRKQFGPRVPTFVLRVFLGEREIGDVHRQRVLRLEGLHPNILIGLDPKDLVVGVAWQQLDEPLLLPGSAEQELPDYEAKLINNPLAVLSLGDLGIAVDLDGFEDLDEDAVLVVPYQPEDLSGLDIKTIRLFEANRPFGSAEPIWNSGINPEGGFVWGKVRRPGLYLPIGVPRDRFVLALMQDMAQRRRLLTESAYYERESIRLTEQSLETMRKIDDEAFEDLRWRLTIAELQTTAVPPRPGEVRLGNDGAPEPFALPGNAKIGEFRERLAGLKIRPEGLPEEALFFPPLPPDSPPPPWPTIPAEKQQLPLPTPVPDAPLPIPWPPDPPVPVPEPLPIPLPEDLFMRWRIPELIIPPLMLCWLFDKGWWMYHHDTSLSGAAICSNIRSTTASTLHEHYSRTLNGQIISIPSVVNGKIYVATATSSASGRSGTVYKYDLATGSKDAEFPLPISHATRPGEVPLAGARQGGRTGVASSPAVVNGKVYVSALTGFLYCLDANTLACLWYTDLRKRHLSKNQPIEHPSGDMANGWSSPLVVNDRVYVGMGEGEHDTYGFVYCLNAQNGWVEWIFCTNKYIDSMNDVNHNQVNVLPPALCQSTVPSPFSIAPNNPPEPGSSPWSHCSYDAGLNRIYVGTGNADPDNPLPDPFYASGVLSLDATTGQYKGFFQPPPASSYRPSDLDVDVPAGPMLFTRNGMRYVGIGSKNGSYFVLNADTLALTDQRQLLPKQLDGSPFSSISGVGENKSGVMATSAVNYSQQKIFVPLGGYAGTASIDSNTTPFMRAVRLDNLNDAWPTTGTNPPKYSNVGATMYTTPGEAGMSSPATVNDVVVMGTTASGLYLYDAGNGLHLRTLRPPASPGAAGTMGPAVYGSYIVAGFYDGTLRVYRL